MKNMDMQTAASAIRGMYCMLKEMDCLTAEVERLTAENVNLRSKCERLREHAERPENGAEPIKTDQRGIWDCSNDSWERLPERYDDAFRDKEARVKAEVEMIEEQRERTW